MEILIVVLILGVSLGLFSIMFIFLDGLPMVEPLEKLEYIAGMGVVLAPCVVMSTDEFGEPYTLQTWAISIGIMVGCLLLSIFLRVCIDWIESNADRRQIKRLKKNKQKAVKNLLGRRAAKKYKNDVCIEKVEDTSLKPKEKRNIRVTFALYLVNAKNFTISSAFCAPVLIVLNGGLEKIFDPLCILSVLLGIGLSLLCGWIAKKISPEIFMGTKN